MSKSFPDFLVIGAGKSGTTSLYYHLKQHPEVFVPEVKEPNFFALEGEKIVSGKGDDPDEMNYYPWAITNYNDYKALYKDAKPGQVKGDVSPMYLYHPNSIKNIKKYAPEAKLIAILRQPAERLYSRFQHLSRDNRKPTDNFEDSMIRGNIWWERNDLVQEGFFYQHLSRYYEHFPKEQILVFLYDDLKINPEEVVRKIYNFIGVSPDFLPDLKFQYNISGEVKNKQLDNLIGRKSFLLKTIKGLAPGGYAFLKKNQSLKKVLNKWRNKNLTPVPLKNEVKKKVTNDIYKEDILNLQDLLDRDLNSWL